MCLAIEYDYQQQRYKPFFPNPNAMLPIVKKDQSVLLLPWGRREQQTGKLPLGGWARLESIKRGVWQKYFPKPVKISAASFAEKDHHGKIQWFDLSEGQYIQGLVARDQQEFRIYVVTVSPIQTDAIHDRWPRIINVPRF